jgi:hypothetical protein
MNLSGAKARILCDAYGTAEAVPFPILSCEVNDCLDVEERPFRAASEGRMMGGFSPCGGFGFGKEFSQAAWSGGKDPSGLKPG